MEIEKAFENIMVGCSPYFDMNYMVDLTLGTRKSNYIGGCGDIRTQHEQVFSLLFPELDPQVSFGSGKGGMKKYGFKRVVVDFYDDKRKIAIEIDGKNHKSREQAYKDAVKALMLFREYGVETIRFTNEEVEEMLIKRLEENVN